MLSKLAEQKSRNEDFWSEGRGKNKQPRSGRSRFLFREE